MFIRHVQSSSSPRLDATSKLVALSIISLILCHSEAITPRSSSQFMMPSASERSSGGLLPPAYATGTNTRRFVDRFLRSSTSCASDLNNAYYMYGEVRYVNGKELQVTCLPMCELMKHTRATCTETTQEELLLLLTLIASVFRLALFVGGIFVDEGLREFIQLIAPVGGRKDHTSNVDLSYGTPLTLPRRVDKRPPR